MELTYKTAHAIRGEDLDRYRAAKVIISDNNFSPVFRICDLNILSGSHRHGI